jgi:hypothetical protein
MAPPDGGGALALDLNAPKNPQIALAYGMPVLLQVRYHQADATSLPVAHAPVRFSFFGDPAGSTLSSDLGQTDADGLAQVTLTAGQADASFHVIATAANAAQVVFEVGVLANVALFVEIDAGLSWNNPTPAAYLSALLYDSLSCAALPPSQMAPVQWVRAGTPQLGAQMASFQFTALLARDYAVVARATDASGKLLGYGCVNLPATIVPQGSISMVPVPLSPVIASPVGSFTLTTMLTPMMTLAQPALMVWQRFGTCQNGVEQMLLDAIETQAPSLAMLIHMQRDTSCPPTSTSSLDQQLQTLLITPASKAIMQLSSDVADLGKITAALTVTSQLTISPLGGTSYVGEHVLQTAMMFNGAMYPLPIFALPLLDSKEIPINYDGTTLRIGMHGFTLGFLPLWGQTLSDIVMSGLGVPPRMTPIAVATQTLVTGIVTPAARSGKMGCAAVEDLICTAIGMSGTCGLQTACNNAIMTVAGQLSGPFAPPATIDLTWSGTATAMDSTGMLVIDTLTSGAWTSTALMGGNFTGARAP